MRRGEWGERRQKDGTYEDRETRLPTMDTVRVPGHDRRQPVPPDLGALAAYMELAGIVRDLAAVVRELDKARVGAEFQLGRRVSDVEAAVDCLTRRIDNLPNGLGL